MVVFDTNIFIYAGVGKLSLSKIDGVKACYASITVIETLGFHEITSVEQRKLTQILEAYQMIDLSESIIQRAVTLRQDRKMSLGDSIIAATALEHSLTLWTANTKDFSHIHGLNTFNPLTKPQ
jgi:predicted nucleic acid-binding protein